MDSSVNLPNINLRSARLDNIRAEIGEDSKSEGGTLAISVNTSLVQIGDSNQAEGNVEIIVIAFPKGVDVKQKKKFAFKIQLESEGIFEWAKGYKPNLEDESTEEALLQSLYVLAVTEAINIGHKLGFSGLSIPLDFKKNKALSAKSSSVIASSKKVRSASKIKQA